MPRSLAFAAACALTLLAAPGSRAQANASSKRVPPAVAMAEAGAQPIDGVAARIQDDVITESEVRELRAFQQLVDGEAKPRSEVIQELADQWIVRGEAKVANYPQPSKEDVDRAYAELVKQFPSPDDFAKRCAAAGITGASARRMVGQQLYLARFLDYRFRPAAQVTDAQIEAYYRDEFSAQLKAKGAPIPALASVEDTIREVLIQREIDDRSAKWLDDTRGRLALDIVAHGEQP